METYRFFLLVMQILTLKVNSLFKVTATMFTSLEHLQNWYDIPWMANMNQVKQLCHISLKYQLKILETVLTNNKNNKNKRPFSFIDF